MRIFNEKEVDELVVLDMDPARGVPIQISLLEEIASEAFMPVAYGGGIGTLQAGRSLIGLGLEKVVINSAQATAPDVIPGLVGVLGSQAVVGRLTSGANGRAEVVHPRRRGSSDGPQRVEPPATSRPWAPARSS